ncbi:MAG: hypothetical protein GKS00_15765 [Alphaproteobacteria bacterium]|nr:hypothetical protein [Alphaproteobacteria bacterium]
MTKKKRFPLPKRFIAPWYYARLRALNAKYGLGNNYLLVVLLEHLDDYAEPDKLEAAFTAFIEEYAAPKTS